MAAHLLKTMVTHLSLILLHGEMEKIKFYLCLDSMSTALQLIGKPAQKLHLRLTEKIERELDLVDQGFRRDLKLMRKINFLWLPSQHLPADINSKSSDRFTHSPLWLHGPSLFLDQDLIDRHIFATYSEKKF